MTSREQSNDEQGMQQSADVNIRSFRIIIYDAEGTQLTFYRLPFSVVAPFGNRLFREMPEIRRQIVREPWYLLVPGPYQDFVRSPQPIGPTSLYAFGFDPDTLTKPTIHLYAGAQVRYFTVRLFDYQWCLFKGDYSVDDIFLDGAHYLLHQGHKNGQIPAGRGPYTYEVIPETQPIHRIKADLLPADAWEVEGVFRLPPRIKEEPRIQFRPVPEPPLPERDAEDFGKTVIHGNDCDAPGRIFMPSNIYDDLHVKMELSQSVEQGGYVLGQVYRQPGSPAKEDDPEFKWVLEITHLLMGENMVGSPAMLLFTGDTWSKNSRRRERDFADQKLAGWFHTHLFPASDYFGLSGLDQQMHAWYLSKPWQIAVLLNLESDGRRTVRCFQRSLEGVLEECRFEVFGL